MPPRLDLAKAFAILLARCLARVLLREITLEERRLRLHHLPLYTMGHDPHPALDLTRVIGHTIPTRNAVRQRPHGRHRTGERRVGVQGRALLCQPRPPSIPSHYLIYMI